MYAMLLFLDTLVKNAFNASRPPADAPSPTIGKAFRVKAFFAVILGLAAACFGLGFVAFLAAGLFLGMTGPLLLNLEVKLIIRLRTGAVTHVPH
jgi:hypothetical protein